VWDGRSLNPGPGQAAPPKAGEESPSKPPGCGSRPKCSRRPREGRDRLSLGDESSASSFARPLALAGLRCDPEAVSALNAVHAPIREAVGDQLPGDVATAPMAEPASSWVQYHVDAESTYSEGRSSGRRVLLVQRLGREPSGLGVVGLPQPPEALTSTQTPAGSRTNGWWKAHCSP
jgi:hypothetical protein